MTSHIIMKGKTPSLKTAWSTKFYFERTIFCFNLLVNNFSFAFCQGHRLCNARQPSTDSNLLFTVNKLDI